MRTTLDLWREASPFRIFEDFDQVVGRLIGPVEARDESPRTLSPAYEVEEFDDHFMLSLDMPGLAKEDLKIEIKEEQLTVGGERKKGDKLYSRFLKSFVLPNKIDSTRIEARYEDGVLDIVLPKSAAAQPRTILVQNGQEGFFSRLISKKSDVRDLNGNKAS